MKIGVTGYTPTLDGKIDFFELDFLSENLKKIRGSKILISLNQYFYRRSHPIPLEERIEIIEAKINPAKTIGFCIKLTPRFFETQEIGSEVLPLKKILENNFSLPVYIDLPRHTPSIPLLPKVDPPSFSTDPLWTKPTRGGYWKIHGWHEVRWVRRYSIEQLSKLWQQAESLRPDLISFGHSQRNEQVQEFSSFFSIHNSKTLKKTS